MTWRAFISYRGGLYDVSGCHQYFGDVQCLRRTIMINVRGYYDG